MLLNSLLATFNAGRDLRQPGAGDLVSIPLSNTSFTRNTSYAKPQLYGAARNDQVGGVICSLGPELTPVVSGCRDSDADLYDRERRICRKWCMIRYDLGLDAQFRFPPHSGFIVSTGSIL